MERLTYKLKKPTQNGFEYIGINGANAQKVLKKLGELEDLEEQGLLLKLPCKVGGYSLYCWNKMSCRWRTIWGLVRQTWMWRMHFRQNIYSFWKICIITFALYDSGRNRPKFHLGRNSIPNISRSRKGTCRNERRIKWVSLM